MQNQAQNIIHKNGMNTIYVINECKDGQLAPDNIQFAPTKLKGWKNVI